MYPNNDNNHPPAIPVPAPWWEGDYEISVEPLVWNYSTIVISAQKFVDSIGIVLFSPERCDVLHERLENRLPWPYDEFDHAVTRAIADAERQHAEKGKGKREVENG